AKSQPQKLDKAKHKEKNRSRRRHENRNPQTKQQGTQITRTAKMGQTLRPIETSRMSGTPDPKNRSERRQSNGGNRNDLRRGFEPHPVRQLSGKLKPGR